MTSALVPLVLRDPMRREWSGVFESWLRVWFEADTARIERELRWCVEQMDEADVHALQTVYDERVDNHMYVDADGVRFTSPRTVACSWPKPPPPDIPGFLEQLRAVMSLDDC